MSILNFPNPSTLVDGQIFPPNPQLGSPIYQWSAKDKTWNKLDSDNTLPTGSPIVDATLVTSGQLSPQRLSPSGVKAGIYTDPIIEIDYKGRILSAVSGEKFGLEEIWMFS